MNTRPLTPATLPGDPRVSSAIGVTMVYADRDCGLRAKRFSDMIIGELGLDCSTTPGCWRLEMLELPAIAEDAAREAATSEIVILSLRGDSQLSAPIKHWIESWVADAAGTSACLVALIDSETSSFPGCEGARYYLRQVAGSAGVGFFAHSTAAREDGVPKQFHSLKSKGARRLQARSHEAAGRQTFPDRSSHRLAHPSKSTRARTESDQ